MTAARGRTANRARPIDNVDVLTAAATMLQDVDVADFSVRELAKSMRLVPGTIYARFGSKDELLAQLFVARLAELGRVLDQMDCDEIRTLEQLIAAIAPEASRLRQEYDMMLVRVKGPSQSVRNETWIAVLQGFDSVSRRFFEHVRRVAANEGVTVRASSLRRRFVWTLLASSMLANSEVAYKHTTIAYQRYISRVILDVLARA